MLSFYHRAQQKIRGFGLIEMILYVSICSVILLSLSAFYIFLISSRIKSQVITDVEQQGLYLVHLISSTVRNARNVDLPIAGAGGVSLSLTTADSLLNPTIFDVTASGTMRIKEGSGPYIPLTNSHVTISSSSFQNIASSSSLDRVVRFTFTISGKNISGRNEYSYSKVFLGSATIRQ